MVQRKKGSRVRTCGPGYRIELKLVPVGIRRLPADEAELKSAVQNVFEALTHMRQGGYSHNDVRWPNIVFHDGGWVLIDVENASFWDPNLERRDIQMVGQLLQQEPAGVYPFSFQLSADVLQLGATLQEVDEVSKAVPLVNSIVV